MTARSRNLRALALAGVVLALAPRALAQSEAPESAEDATYSKLVADAVAAFDAGHFRQSRELLARAHQLRPNARTLRGMGLAAFEEGRYALAVVALDGALKETRQPMSPEQRAECEQLLSQANALTGRINVTGKPADGVLKIDGEPAVWDSNGLLIVDQGTHTLTLEQPGGRARNWSLTAIGGHRSEFVLAAQDRPIVQLEDSEVPPPIASEALAPVAADEDAESTPAGISNAVAYAALAGAAVTGGLAIWQWSERESEVEAWNSDDCLRRRRTRRANCGDHEDAYQRAETWGWVAAGATVALSAGAITLLLLNQQSEEQRPHAALPVCVPGPAGFACRMAF